MGGSSGEGKATKFRSTNDLLDGGRPGVAGRSPSIPAHLCEPGRSAPDGKQIAVLLRENSRKFNSFVILRRRGPDLDAPRSCRVLTGDRHVEKYGPMGGCSSHSGHHDESDQGIGSAGSAPMTTSLPGGKVSTGCG
jgi:hypothetical protein